MSNLNSVMFSCIWKKDCKAFGKTFVTFFNNNFHNIAYMVNLFVYHYIYQLWVIAYQNYSKFCTRKCKKLCVLRVVIIMTHYSISTAEGTKPLSNALQQGFRLQTTTGAPSIYTEINIYKWNESGTFNQVSRIETWQHLLIQ